MQRGVVAQVLLHAQVKVEGALLEHHAQLAQGRACGVAQRAAAHADVAMLQVVQPGEQGDQGRLAGAVGAQQGGETPGRQAEADLPERLALAVGKAHVTDFEGIHGVTTTPQG
ncbi:hypothetical protein D3C81_1703520 [compost metagenome]